MEPIMEKINELVRRGNVDRIIVRKEEKVLVDVPMNVGLLGGAAVLVSSKLLLVAGAVATVGFGCTVEVIREDGVVTQLVNDQTAQKVCDTAKIVVEDVKNAFAKDVQVDIEVEFDETVSADEPAEENEE